MISQASAASVNVVLKPNKPSAAVLCIPANVSALGLGQHGQRTLGAGASCLDLEVRERGRLRAGCMSSVMATDHLRHEMLEIRLHQFGWLKVYVGCTWCMQTAGEVRQLRPAHCRNRCRL